MSVCRECDELIDDWSPDDDYCSGCLHAAGVLARADKPEPGKELEFTAEYLQELEKELQELEKTDPNVAKSSAEYDKAVRKIIRA